jgi:S-adenosyl methyltransferase
MLLMNELDPLKANAARMYDLFLGGKDNYVVDRDAVAALMEVFPEAPQLARANRVFALDAIQRAARSGIRQFLDIGAGLPTSPNVFEVAGQYPGTRVVGVDNDPVVLSHCRARPPMGGVVDQSIVVIDGDVRCPEAIFADWQLRDVLDLEQPVAVLLAAVLHFVGDIDDPAAIVTRIRQRLAPGSVIALSHACSTGSDPTAVDHITKIYSDSDVRLHFRPEDQIRSLLSGVDLAHPGWTDVQHWPASPTLDLPETFGELVRADNDPYRAPPKARMVATVTAPVPG